MKNAALKFAIIASIAAFPGTGSAHDGLRQYGRWLVDGDGRVVTIHGGNVMLPDAPAKAAGRFTAETPARMAEQGFNGVRLVIFLSALMPQPGVIDKGYLYQIEKAVGAYGAAGIHTLIDFHQDEYSALVGARGMPNWAVFSDGYQRMPGIEFPVGYFRDPAVQRSFDNFWKNHPVPGTGKGVQDFYLEGLRAVADHFRDNPSVIGIDVMNEPATGSRCAQPDPGNADCPELEQELLKPFYARAAKVINQVAPHLIVFVEPFMLQGALGTPINTPIAGKAGQRGLSFHNYGPIKATRERVNDGALALATREGAAILNTEWGFSNDPAEITGQATDFDTRHISWLAWPRGAFEALVDPGLPDEGNGNRVAILRAYARPYAEVTAGTPQSMQFDGDSGTLRYRYVTRLPNGKSAGGGETRIRLPVIQYPHGYNVTVEGGSVSSAYGSSTLTIRNDAKAASVAVTVARIGELPPLPKAPVPEGGEVLALPPIPPGPLTRNSLLGHIVATPGGRAILDRQVPGMLAGLGHVHGWQMMSIAGIQQFASGTLTEAKVIQIESDLATLRVTPGPVGGAAPNLSLDSLTSDLLADPRSRAILDREVPRLSASPQQSLFPQTKLRDLQPVMPDVLTDEVLARVGRALDTLR